MNGKVIASKYFGVQQQFLLWFCLRRKGRGGMYERFFQGLIVSCPEILNPPHHQEKAINFVQMVAVRVKYVQYTNDVHDVNYTMPLRCRDWCTVCTWGMHCRAAQWSHVLLTKHIVQVEISENNLLYCPVILIECPKWHIDQCLERRKIMIYKSCCPLMHIY